MEPGRSLFKETNYQPTLPITKNNMKMEEFIQLSMILKNIPVPKRKVMATKKNNLVSNMNTLAPSNNWSTKKDPVPKKVSPVPKKTTVSHFSYKKHATIFDLGTKKYVKIRSYFQK